MGHNYSGVANVTLGEEREYVVSRPGVEGSTEGKVFFKVYLTHKNQKICSLSQGKLIVISYHSKE